MLDRVAGGMEFLLTRSIRCMAQIAPIVPLPAITFKSRLELQGLVRWVAERSPHYRTKLSEYKIDPRRVRDISDLSFFTWPEELQRDPESFLCSAANQVFETSGTTGRPKRAYFSHREIDELARYEACALYYFGVRPDDRILCTFDQGFWVTGPVTEATFRMLNVFGSMAGKLNPEDALERIIRDRYSVLMADPTWLLSLTDACRSAGDAPQLKLIYCGGDRLPEATRRYAESIWRCPVLQGYGTTETGGVLATECFHREGLHVDAFNLIVEIVEPDANGFGELVVTTLNRRVMPLIRYRTRDVTRFISGPCPCGATVPRIAPLQTRRDEMVVMGAGNIYPLLLEKLVDGIQGWPHSWYAAVRQEGGRDLLEFRVALNGAASPAELEQKIRDRIRGQQPGMWANHECHMYRIAVVPGEAPPAQGRKLRRLIDER